MRIDGSLRESRAKRRWTFEDAGTPATGILNHPTLEVEIRGRKRVGRCEPEALEANEGGIWLIELVVVKHAAEEVKLHVVGEGDVGAN